MPVAQRDGSSHVEIPAGVAAGVIAAMLVLIALEQDVPQGVALTKSTKAHVVSELSPHVLKGR